MIFKQVQPEWLKTVQVGDTVKRMLAGVVPMALKITEVTDKIITCGAWTFNRFNGWEIDEELGWDGETHTGSQIFDQPN